MKAAASLSLASATIPLSMVQPMSPARFAPFDGRADVMSLVLTKTGTILWGNRSFAEKFGHTVESIRGVSSFSLWKRSFMMERLALLDRALREHRNVAYFQLIWGRRMVTRVWPLDPAAFTEPGFFIVIEPAPARDLFPDAPIAPTAAEIGLGELQQFSRRELEVVRFVGEGMSNKDIGSVMHVSVKTVENHVAHALQVLRVHSRVELARYATERGLTAFTAEEWSGLLAKHSDPGDVNLSNTPS